MVILKASSRRLISITILCFMIFNEYHIAANAESPNVIIFLTDDIGYGDISPHGNTKVNTPTLRRLHKESIRLTNFHVDPSCSPTRAAMLTGRYSHRVGTWHTVTSRSYLRKDETTMAEVFRNNGYETAIFGKWHLGENYPYRPVDRGFESSLIHRGGGIGQTPDFFGNKYGDFVAYRNEKEEKQEGFCTDVWTREAVKFIEENKQKPFFALIATNAAHAPFTPKRKDVAQYFKFRRMTPRVRNFYALISNIDENVGIIDEKLKELQLREKTIFIFTSDNGSAGKSFNAGFRGYKTSEYDGGHRVPFFIRFPQLFTDGRDINKLSAHIDLLPTLVDLCKLKFKEKPGYNLDGVSLAPLLADKSAEKALNNRFLVVESQRIDTPRKWKNTAVMMSDENGNDWRLVNARSLYNMKLDKGQRYNVIHKRRGLAKQLSDFYDSWWRSVSATDNRVSHFSIGGDQNEVLLTAHDWQGTKYVPWNQVQIIDKICRDTAGYWPVYVEKDGTYEFHVSRWPKETKLPVQLGNSIRYLVSKLRMNETTYSSEKLLQSSLNATFTQTLKRGYLKISAQFTNEGIDKARNVRSCGAYFVYVRKVIKPNEPSDGDLGSITHPPSTAPSSSSIPPRPIYQPNWNSLKSLPLPEWINEAKFGIFIHWGPYSVVGDVWHSPVPGYKYTEWLPRYMYRYAAAYSNNIRRSYGAPIPSYADMIDLFKGENFDASEWAELFKQAGAKYVVPVAEHHDGFAMWDSELTEWDAVEKGPKKDIIGLLEKATRSKGLKFGVSYHRERHWWYYANRKGEGPSPKASSELRNHRDRWGLYGPFDTNDKFMEDYAARCAELVEKYSPEFLWIDGINDRLSRFNQYLPSMMANFVNHGLSKGLNPYVNNKHDRNFPAGFGLTSVDNLQLGEIATRQWENPATLGISYGYSKEEELKNSYKSVKELIWLLINTVSKNGILLLNVGPKPDGTIAPNQQQRLKGMGQWLGVNGQAIYGTTPWKKFGYDDVRFTVKGNILYLTKLNWKDNQKAHLIRFSSTWQKSDISTINFVNGKKYTEKVPFKKTENGIVIYFDKSYSGGDFQFGYVFAIKLKKSPLKLAAV